MIMYLIIVGFHLALIVSIVLLIQALYEKKQKQKALLAKTDNAKPQTKIAAVPVPMLTEQQRAVRLVHTGLSNVLEHVTNLDHPPEKTLNQVQKVSNATESADSEVKVSGQVIDPTKKVCSKCGDPWDSSFEFCLKCGHTEA